MAVEKINHFPQMYVRQMFHRNGALELFLNDRVRKEPNTGDRAYSKTAKTCFIENVGLETDNDTMRIDVPRTVGK
jgi:hypothetical protein